MKNATQRGNFIKDVRDADTKFIEAKDALSALQKQLNVWTAAGDVLVAADFVGEDIDLLGMFQAIWSTVTAIENMFTANPQHSANLYGLKR